MPNIFMTLPGLARNRNSMPLNQGRPMSRDHHDAGGIIDGGSMGMTSPSNPYGAQDLNIPQRYEPPDRNPEGKRPLGLTPGRPVPTVAPGVYARGGLTAAAEHLRRAGGPDDRLVHMSGRELDLLRNEWGEPGKNADTGLPSYGWFDDILSTVGDVVGGIGSNIPIIGPLVQGISSMAQGFMQPNTGTQAGVRDQATGQYNMFTPQNYGSSNGGGSPTTYANWTNTLGSALGLLGALSTAHQRASQQKHLQRQQAAQYANYMGPHVNYDFSQPTTETIGLTPSHPSELSGFYPEEQMTKTQPLPYARGGRPVGYNTGGAIGVHDYVGGGQVSGSGGGQADTTLARVSQDEYVMPADVVSHLGDGSSTDGAQKLDGLVKQVRTRRVGHAKFPKRIGALSLRMGR